MPAARVRAERGTAATGVAHGGVAAGGAIAFLLSTAGSTLVLVAEPLALFVRRQALEGVDGAANDIPPVDVRCVAVHAPRRIGSDVPVGASAPRGWASPSLTALPVLPRKLGLGVGPTRNIHSAEHPAPTSLRPPGQPPVPPGSGTTAGGH